MCINTSSWKYKCLAVDGYVTSAFLFLVSSFLCTLSAVCRYMKDHWKGITLLREEGQGALKCIWEKIENWTMTSFARTEIMFLCIQQFCDNSVGFALYA